MMRVFLEQGPSGRRLRTGRGVDRRAVQPHELPALRLPIVDRADPEDRRLQADEARRVREGRAPLPCPVPGGGASYSLCFAFPAFAGRRFTLVLAGGPLDSRLLFRL